MLLPVLKPHPGRSQGAHSRLLELTKDPICILGESALSILSVFSPTDMSHLKAFEGFSLLKTESTSLHNGL